MTAHRLEYKHVLRGEDRLRAAAKIHKLREQRLTYRQIGEILGIPLSKVCVIHHTIDPSLFEKYMEEEDNE